MCSSVLKKLRGYEKHPLFHSPYSKPARGYSFCPNSLSNQVLPTCLAPSSTSGFLNGPFFHLISELYSFLFILITLFWTNICHYYTLFWTNIQKKLTLFLGNQRTNIIYCMSPFPLLHKVAIVVHICFLKFGTIPHLMIGKYSYIYFRFSAKIRSITSDFQHFQRCLQPSSATWIRCDLLYTSKKSSMLSLLIKVKEAEG